MTNFRKMNGSMVERIILNCSTSISVDGGDVSNLQILCGRTPYGGESVSVLEIRVPVFLQVIQRKVLNII
jgi:hypothetical protein